MPDVWGGQTTGVKTVLVVLWGSLVAVGISLPVYRVMNLNQAAAAAEARLPHTLAAAQAAPPPASTVPSSPQTQAAGEDVAASSPGGVVVNAGANAMTSSDAGAPTSPTPPHAPAATTRLTPRCQLAAHLALTSR